MAKTTQDSSRIKEAFRFFQGCNGSAFASKSMEKEVLHHGKPLNGLASSTAFQKVHPPDKCKTCSSNDSEHSEPKGKKPEFKSIIHVTKSKQGEPSKDSNSSDCLKTENSVTESTVRETCKSEKVVSKEEATESTVREICKSEKVVSKEEIKTEVSSEKGNSSCTTEGSCSSFKQESRTEDDMVVMRKASKSKEEDKGRTSETDAKDLTQTLGTPLDKVEVMTPKRGTCKVVSDAFNFLKDGVEGGNSIARDSGIPQGGGEDKIFNKLLTLDEGMESPKDTQNDNSSNNSAINGTATDGCSNQSSPANKRKAKRQRNASVSSTENSEDSEDEDTGIYNESFRKSVWLCVPEEKGPSELQSSSIAEENETDEVFLRGVESTLNRSHKRTDSTNTTHSESEFKHEYRLRRKCMVHRHDSQQEYHRMSARVYEHEKLVVIVKEEHDKDFGLHIFESHPAIITDVDTGSPAHRAGLRAGQILLSVNGSNALELSHEEIIQLIQKDSTMVKLEVASSGEVHHIRNQQTPVFSGFMCKQSNSTFVKNWRRRFFVLRFDNCLYYYKTEQDQDPLGAIPLLNYIVSKQTDSSKEHCFKAEKFGARTYYFIADSREDMINWISTLNEAATRAKEKKDAWMDVTACNVGLPALDIKKPDCFGYLSKCGRTVKTWKKRYCVLKDACIYYYKNVNSANAQGMAHLHGYKVEPMTSTLRKHGFLLRPPEPQMRTFSFIAENETDQKRWMSALEKSIQRWIKVD